MLWVCLHLEHFTWINHCSISGSQRPTSKRSTFIVHLLSSISLLSFELRERGCLVFVSLSSLIPDSGLQPGRWAKWQGAPGPLTHWAAGPMLGQCEAGAHLMSGLLRWAGTRQSGAVLMVVGGTWVELDWEGVKAVNLAKPLTLSGLSDCQRLHANLALSVAVLNGDRPGLRGRKDLTDKLEFLCK